MQSYDGVAGRIEVDEASLTVRSGPTSAPVTARLEGVLRVRITPPAPGCLGSLEIWTSGRTEPAVVRFVQAQSPTFHALHQWLMAVIEVNQQHRQQVEQPGLSFAVIDLETTGFAYKRADRVVEIGIVQLDAQANVENRWTTLVNPLRDVGPTSIHGITARDIVSAPKFADIADAVHGLLAGRIIVAHNAIFDSRFLSAEFGRTGRDLGLRDEHTLCTMRLTRSVLGLAARSLGECCASVGIRNDHAHSALGDADATAALFRIIHEQRDDAVSAAQPLSGVSRRTTITVATCERGSTATAPGTWLSRIAERALAPESHPRGDEYLAMLDSALIDRDLSLAEQDQLCELADLFEIGRTEVDSLHLSYIEALAAQAWEDGVITDVERADLRRVAELLDVPVAVVDSHLAKPPTAPSGRVGRFELRPGDRVTLTGDMRVPRAEWMVRAADAGLVVAPSVTKKNVLLVAADPDSLSGKAKTAREYGIPIVHEQAFAALLDAMQVQV